MDLSCCCILDLVRLFHVAFLVRHIDKITQEQTRLDLWESRQKTAFANLKTLLNELGYEADYIEKQLAHNPRDKIRGVYNRAEYLPERRKMMQEWADYLTALRSTV